jgi:hypothetical protein
MKWIVVVGMVSALAFAASAQVDPDFQRKMDEVNRRAASRPTTGPSAAVVEARERAKAPQLVTIYRATVKPESPEWVKKWIETVPETRKRRIIAAYELMLTAESSARASRDKIQQIAKSDEPASEKAKLLRLQRASAAEAAAKLQDARRRIREIQATETGLQPYQMRYDLGEVGAIGYTQVLQVLDHQTMRVRYPSQIFRTLRLVGRDTTGVVDDSAIQLDGVFRITGTETYLNAMNALSTEFVAEPVDLTPYVELVPEEVSREWLEEELEQICGEKVPQPAK